MNRQLRQALVLLRNAKRAETWSISLERAYALLTPPRKRPTKQLPKALQSTKPQRSAAHRMSTKEIREACMARANWRCECGCNRWFDNGLPGRRPEMDEWLGGSGRRQQKKSIQTCWILVDYCHKARTNNEPSAAWWNGRFKAHCERHGYPVLQHIEHKPLSRRGTA